jgi:hypothetical protein
MKTYKKHFEGMFIGHAREVARRLLKKARTGDRAIITAYNGGEWYSKTKNGVRRITE